MESDNNVTNNNVSNNGESGIYLEGEDNTTIAGNTINSNMYGIYFTLHTESGYIRSKDNTITNNIIFDNTYGIYFVDSSNNTIYNNYFNNTNNAYDDGNNAWNITRTNGTNIIGGPYLGGNYWGDYAGEDTNEDGIGDTQLPYKSAGEITVGGDWLPLTPTNVSVETSTGTGTAAFSTDSGEFADITGVNEDSLPQEAKDNKPGGLTLPHGLFSFTITRLTPRQSVTLTITLPDPVPIGSLWWKVNTTAGNNTWYSLPIGSDDGDNVVTITLTDGGSGDNDGVANGVIVDPSGIGIPSAPPASISNLTNITGQTWINWTWTNPPDADFNYTMVYLNGTWQTNTSDPFYNATGLASDTYYEIGTHTVDEVGNVNTTWVNQTTKTLAVPDTTPPASISNLQNVTGQTWINWTWTNPPDADFNYTMIYLNGTLQTNTSDPFYNATGLAPDTYYEIGTHTVDKVGNVNMTWVNQTTKTKTPAVIPANVVIKPETLNLKSKGKFTAFITLPDGYNVTDIDVSTVVCEGAYAVKGMVADDKYIAKFNIQDLVGVEPGDAVTLTVRGKLFDGTPLGGSDTIRVIEKGKGK